MRPLTRELKGSRILLVGLYRPNDLAAGLNQERHPFEQTRNEIIRYYGEICIDLDEATNREGRQFIDDLIDSQPNDLSGTFRDALFAHSGGHALFTVELLRAMQETGDLVQDPQGRWREASTLDWNELPARVEAIIEERVGRLTEELREILDVACVEGHDFTAQVIMQIQQSQPRDLVRKLSRELGSRHKLVHENGEINLGKSILSRYSFNHALFQSYLYNALDITELRLLHAYVGDALEKLYDKYLEEIAVQLAFHYTKSGATAKASIYLQMAGAKALRVGEFNQARLFYNQALDTIDSNNPEEADKRRAQLLWGIGQTYYHTGHLSIAATQYSESLEAARHSGDKDATIQALIGLASSLRKQQINDKALEAAKEAIEIAHQTGKRLLECKALRIAGTIYGQLDQIEDRLSYYNLAHQIAIELNDADEKMNSINSFGAIYGSVYGDYVKAVEYYEDALDIAVRHHSLVGQALYLSNLIGAYRRLGNHKMASELITKQLDLRNKIGDIPGTAGCYEDFGILLLHRGNIQQAIQHWKHAIHLGDQYTQVTVQVSARNWLVMGYLSLDQLENATHIIDEAKPLLSKFHAKIQVFSEPLLEAVTCLRRGQTDRARTIFEGELADAVGLFNTKRWSYHYHRAFAQAGLTLLAPPEARESTIQQTLAYFSDALEICGWVGVLDDALLFLRELRKADPANLLQPVEDQLVEKRQIAWKNRPFKD